MYMNDEYIRNRIKTFCENVEKNGSIKNINDHNIYFIQTEDMDGNITNEAFASNLVTQSGLRIFACGCNNSYETQIITFGTGTTTPSINDTSLEARVSAFDISWNNQINPQQAPFDPAAMSWSYWYNSTDGTLCCRVPYLKGTIDYNVSGINADVDIYEIGLYIHNHNKNYDNTIAQNIATRSFIYDSLGNVTYITKKCNEKLTVTVFLTFSEKISMIGSHYSNGEYAYLHPYALSYRGFYAEGGRYHRYIGSDLYAFDQSAYAGMMYANYTYDTTNNRVNPHFTSTAWSKLFGENNKHEYVSTHVEGSGFGNWFYENSVDRFQIYKYLKSTTPENITCYDMWTNNENDNKIDMRFGRYWNAFNNLGQWNENSAVGNVEGRRYLDHVGCLPVTDFHMTSSKMYNYNTKAWDIVDSFTDAPYADYSRYFRLCTKTKLPTYAGAYDPSDTNEVEYGIYVNPKNNILPPFSLNQDMPEHIPITKMRLQTNRNIYATDTWWDARSFQLIDPNNIDVSLQTKKYYLAQGGSAGYIEETRNQTVHSIDCGGPYYNIQVTEPDDWSTNYTSYYTKNGSTYEQVTGVTAPTFVANTYYEKTNAYETILPDQSEHVIINLKDFAYELLTEQPDDWGANYTSYFERSGSPGSYTYSNITGASAPTFASDTYYRNAWESGRFNINYYGGDGSPVADGNWIRLRGYVRLPFNLAQISSLKCTVASSLSTQNIQILFYDRDGKHYNYHGDDRLAYSLTNDTDITRTADDRYLWQSAIYFRIALNTTTIPTNTDDITLDFYKSIFTSTCLNDRGKLLRSNTDDWIALPDRILFPDASGGPVSIPFVQSEVYVTPTPEDDSHDKFIPEMTVGSLRWETGDKLIISDISHNQLSSANNGNAGLWPHNIFLRIFDMTSTVEYPSHVDVRLDFTDWDNDNARANTNGLTSILSYKLWWLSTVDSTHAYLGCWNNDTASKSYSQFIIIKLYDVDGNNVPKQIKLTDVIDPYMIDGTPYVCYYVNNSENPQTMCVYDIETESYKYQSIPCPEGYTLDLRTICGVGNTMYFTAYDASNNYRTFTFDIANGGNPVNTNTLFAGLMRIYNTISDDRVYWRFTNSTNPTQSYGDSGIKMPTPKLLTYNNILVNNAFWTSESIYNLPNKKVTGCCIYTSANPLSPTPLYGGNDLTFGVFGGNATSTGSDWTYAYADNLKFINGQIQLSADGKHLLIVSTATHGLNVGTNRTGQPIVVDLGAQLDNVDHSRQDYLPDIFNDDSYYGITEYHNMIYTQNSNGHICRRELGRFLPHKVEGTTYTITCYNNPKQISGTTSIGMTFGIEANES